MIKSSLLSIKDNLLSWARELLWSTAPGLFDRIVRPYSGQQFAIGIYAGASILALQEHKDANNPVLSYADVSDAPAAFVADPFMIYKDGIWHMLFEVMNRATRRGQIALAQSVDCVDWNYQGTVLREPFHLAYPHMFEHNGELFLIPDSPGNGIRLYRAVQFPKRWEFVREIRSDNSYSDASLFYFEERWWMYVAWAPDSQTAKSLRLFSSADPTSDWIEHPSSPVINRDDRVARPAGKVTIRNGRPVRLTQDCEAVYGKCVHAFEAIELTCEKYIERSLCDRPILDVGPEQWRHDGMHHADVHLLDDGRLIACVDGWRHVPDFQIPQEIS